MQTVFKFTLLACLLATISSLPQEPAPAPAFIHHTPYAPPHLHVAHPAFVRILAQNYDLSPDGSYTFQYESEDGSSRQESGSPKFAPQPGVESYGGLTVSGRFSYASPEGPIDVQYTADENGYQPSGSSIHPAIQKAVAEQVAFARSEVTPHAHIVPHIVPQPYRAPLPVFASPLPPSPTPVIFRRS
ncbi:hypothetical protein PGB90_008556 [Kerria lacca]